jgi:hypothetical protein
MTEREWLQQRRPEWMTDDQLECWMFFAALFHGDHHIPGAIKEFGRGICLNAKSWGCHFATFDYENLTRAVFLAHDRCIRFEIEPSGPGLLKLIAHKRHTREGDSMKRHPTIETALLTWRQKNPAESASNENSQRGSEA